MTVEIAPGWNSNVSLILPNII